MDHIVHILGEKGTSVPPPKCVRRTILLSPSLRQCVCDLLFAFHCACAFVQVAYSQRSDIHDVVQRLLSLSYLPSAQIGHAFRHLWRHSEDEGINRLCSYIQSTWIDSTLWPPSAWSVHRRAVRTNNDVEGWHRAVNNKAGRANLQFYVLLPLLLKEAKLLPVQMKLVNEKNCIGACKHSNSAEIHSIVFSDIFSETRCSYTVPRRFPFRCQF